MGVRRQSREATVQALYMCDFLNKWEIEAVQGCFRHFDVPDPVRGYAEAVALGVIQNLTEVDSQITRASEHWSITRMGRVDRAILRMAAFELVFLVDEVPKSVAINEAIEVAKRFGSDESPNFINGVLDKLGNLVRPGENGQSSSTEKISTEKIRVNVG